MSLKPFPLNYDYRVSENGDVYSIKSRCYLRPQTFFRHGHVGVNIKINGKSRPINISRIVLMSFDRLPEEGEQAHHINNIPTDNRLCNLKWVTNTENQRFKADFGTNIVNTGSTNGMSRLKEEDILKIRELHASGLTQDSIAEKFNTTRAYISQIVNRKRWRRL